jgi:hypothetical protein
VLFLLERIPESLNLMIGFQIGIGLSESEAKIPVILEEIYKKQ